MRNRDIHSIRCPHCGAGPGERCRTAGNKPISVDYPHMARVRAWGEAQRKAKGNGEKKRS